LHLVLPDARPPFLDAYRLRFVLHTPWPDFLTVYSGLASGAGWVVPKAYIERVGDEGFKQHPIGLGPYRFVRMDPGVGLVLEAHDRYWRLTLSMRAVRSASSLEKSSNPSRSMANCKATGV